MQEIATFFPQPGPGVAAAVITNTDDVDQVVAGYANIENQTHINEHTVFDLASTSKIFTASAVMLLVEESKLTLDQPITGLLPFLSSPESGREILLQDLLWHTSGLHDYLSEGMYTETTIDDAHVQPLIPDWCQQAQPGRSFEYSNTNYYVLSHVIAEVSGMDFADFMRQRLFEPMGMRDSGFVTESHIREKLATGYVNYGYGVPEWHQAEKIALTLGDGGLCSSLTDLVIWQRAFFSGKVVSECSMQWMQSPGRLDSGEYTQYGGGLQVEGLQNHRWYGHAGSWVGTTAIMGYYPQVDISVIVLSNEQMAPVERITQVLATQAGFKSCE